MSISRLLFVSAALLALLPFSAQANRMSYGFVQITGLLNTDVENDNFEEDGDGLGIRGSWIMGPYLFMDGRYDDVDLTDDTESRSGSLRLGWRQPLDLRSPLRLDVYGMVSAEALELESNGTELINDEGVGLTAGLRFGPIPQLEAGLEYNFIDYGDDKGQFIALEGIWNVSDWFALVLEYRDGEYNVKNLPDVDRSDLNIGLRWVFGGDDQRELRGRPLHQP